MRTRQKWFVVSALVLFAHAVAGEPLADINVGRLRVAFDQEARFRILYKGITIVPQGQIYLADKAWGTIFPLRNKSRFDSKLEGTEQKQVCRITARKNDINECTIECTVEARRVMIDLTRKVLPNTSAHYVVWDVFLSKPFLAGSKFAAEGSKGKQEGTLDPQTSKAAIDRVTALQIHNYAGCTTFSLESNGSAAPGFASSWQFRNVCDRTWGDKELRSFSLLNCRTGVPAAGGEQHLRFELALDESPGLDAALERRQLENGVQALHNAVQKQERRLGMEPSDAPQTPESTDAVFALQDRLMRQLDSLRGRPTRLIVPQPQKIEWTTGEFRFGRGTCIFIGPQAGRGAAQAVQVIADELRVRFGWAPQAPVQRGNMPATAVVIGDAPGDKVVVDSTLPAEGYVLQVEPKRIVLAGRDDRGVFYAAQSLVQLLEKGGGQAPVVPGVRIRDWPELPWRGIHIWGLGSGVTIDDLKRTIRHIAARGKLNAVVFGSSFTGFHWKSHPEIRERPGGITMDQLAEVAQYTRDNLMEFVPAFQSFGHLDHLFRSHPEIAESWVAGKRYNSYCPSNPKSYELIFDMFQEVIDATKPKRFHIGHDEITGIGTCDRCKDTPPHVLLARDITKIHGWLKARGVETMLWGDMLLDAGRWSKTNIGATNSNRYLAAKDTHLALDLIPKEVIIADWHYAGVEAFPTLAHYRDSGFRVLACPWYGAKNNFYFAKEAAEAKTMGVLLTDWGFLATLSAAGTSVLGMEYAWTPGRPTLEDLPYYPPEILANQLRPRRPSDNPRAVFRPVDISPAVNGRTTAKSPSDFESWFAAGRGLDLSLMPTGSASLAHVKFELPSQDAGNNCILFGGKDTAPLPTGIAALRVGRAAASVVFLHTMSTRDPGVWHKAIAKYVIHYADGGKVEAEVKQNRDITHWLTYEPRTNPWHWREGYADLYGAKCAWRGLTRSGEEVNLQAYEWVNPDPKRPISHVEFRALRHRERLMIGVLAVTCVE